MNSNKSEENKNNKPAIGQFNNPEMIEDGNLSDEYGNEEEEYIDLSEIQAELGIKSIPSQKAESSIFNHSKDI